MKSRFLHFEKRVELLHTFAPKLKRKMSIATSIKELFARKSEGQPDNNKIDLPQELGGGTIERYSPRYLELNVFPYFCGENYLQLFETVPEVYFPINYIASRIAGATFEVKRVKDERIVY